MIRAYYSSDIAEFVQMDSDRILGRLADEHRFDLTAEQKLAWKYQIDILKPVLRDGVGKIYFEYSIPRMGKRIDVLLVIQSVIFVLEFKVGSKDFNSHDVEQVMDYALDLKNFHETSHDLPIIPILIATSSEIFSVQMSFSHHPDLVFEPIQTNQNLLPEVIKQVMNSLGDTPNINISSWEAGSYKPTPTIIEAALSLYKKHGVEEISRNDAGAMNIRSTSAKVEEIIKNSKLHSKKSICFVTGVPGAGKTLVGLNIANKHMNKESDLYSVFLSGNGPLVKILVEALTRDRVEIEKKSGNKILKKTAKSEVSAFIQNVHHFRDECLIDSKPPAEHVAIFDEAQRAWNLVQTADFMKRKKGRPDFNQSEPSYLISCLDRHLDWAVIVCLVGGGQEINVGEAGISEWLQSIETEYPEWDVYISPNLNDGENTSITSFDRVCSQPKTTLLPELHLATSMRSFRAEHVSSFVKCVLDLNADAAREEMKKIAKKYPIRLTRSILEAKKWLKNIARGTERYGIIVSSQAERLKPLAFDVKSPVDEVHWFLGDKDDVRSSYYLESVATEFQVQGLELDWSCVIWDADLRLSDNQWLYRQFRGKKWQSINKDDRQRYLKNAYRVLLTRARQGMVIVVPEGEANDPTRLPDFYNSTYEYLKSLQIQEI